MIYSYTQISQYLACPRRYRHRYLEGWQEKDSRAAMLFGAIECALAELLTSQKSVAYELHHQCRCSGTPGWAKRREGANCSTDPRREKRTCTQSSSSEMGKREGTQTKALRHSERHLGPRLRLPDPLPRGHRRFSQLGIDGRPSHCLVCDFTFCNPRNPRLYQKTEQKRPPAAA